MPLIFKQACQIISDYLKITPKAPSDNGIKLLIKNKIFSLNEYQRHKLVGLHNCTLSVYLHTFRDENGKTFEIIEKNNRRAWGKPGFFPETYFYGVIVPQKGAWPRVPQGLAQEKGPLSYRLFLEKKTGYRVDLDKNFEDVLKAIKYLQAEAPGLATLPYEAGQLVYFQLPRGKRYRGDYTRYLKILSKTGLILTNQAEIFEAGLSALAERCATFAPVLNHLDLLPGNILIDEGHISFIDWEKYCYAPAGFSHGNWLYSVFRKKEADEFSHYLQRWNKWLKSNYSNSEQRDERILAGLFCYFCFVLEYLARQYKSRPKGLTRKHVQDSAKALMKQLSFVSEPQLLHLPQNLLNQLITIQNF